MDIKDIFLYFVYHVYCIYCTWIKSCPTTITSTLWLCQSSSRQISQRHEESKKARTIFVFHLSSLPSLDQHGGRPARVHCPSPSSCFRCRSSFEGSSQWAPAAFGSCPISWSCPPLFSSPFLSPYLGCLPRHSSRTPYSPCCYSMCGLCMLNGTLLLMFIQFPSFRMSTFLPSKHPTIQAPHRRIPPSRLLLLLRRSIPMVSYINSGCWNIGIFFHLSLYLFCPCQRAQ